MKLPSGLREELWLTSSCDDDVKKIIPLSTNKMCHSLVSEVNMHYITLNLK